MGHRGAIPPTKVRDFAGICGLLVYTSVILFLPDTEDASEPDVIHLAIDTSSARKNGYFLKNLVAL